MRVLKFGGAALRDGAAVRHAARIVARCGGERPVVVVSAHQGVTAQLERAVREARAGATADERERGASPAASPAASVPASASASAFSALDIGPTFDAIRIRHRTILRQLGLPGDLLDRHLAELRAILGRLRVETNPNPRFRDYVLSFGERMSARVVAGALRQEGIDATPLDAPDLGLVTDQGKLGPPGAAAERIRGTLAALSGVPVITGFLALDREGNLTTLGRNGTDLTASWLGAAVGADEVQLWKRVPGLLTADPTLVPDARRLPNVSWSEAEALARHGSGVLHPGTIEPAHAATLTIEVCDLENPGTPGTRIEGESHAKDVLAVAHRAEVASVRVTFDAARGRSVQMQTLFTTLASAGVEPYLGSIGADEAELVFADDAYLERIAHPLATLGTLDRTLATVTIVGAELDRHEGVERAILGELDRGAREFHVGDEREERGRVLVVRRDAVAATVRRLHTALLPDA